MILHICGVNYKSASLATRELLASDDEEVKKYLTRLLKHDQISECLILSTCNRFEVCAVTEDELDILNLVIDFMSKEKGGSFESHKDEFYTYRDTAAVTHLFKVISGLDSMVTGEPQISGQVRKAYSLSSHTGAGGVVLHKLFHRAFRVSKRIRHETLINRGAGSVGLVAAQLAGTIFREISDCSCLVIGAGKIASVTAKNLYDRNIRTLFIANRTYERAASMASRLGGEAVDFQHVHECINKVDIIISTTGSSENIISLPTMEDILARRTRGPLLIVDIAVPRDFDPRIDQLKDVHLVNINGLKEIVKDNLKNRADEIPKAEMIIEEEQRHFLEWKKTLKVKHLIHGITNKFEEIRSGEMERVRKKMSPEEASRIDEITGHLVRKLVSVPIIGLKNIGRSSHTMSMISRLFDLEDEDFDDEKGGPNAQGGSND